MTTETTTRTVTAAKATVTGTYHRDWDGKAYCQADRAPVRGFIYLSNHSMTEEYDKSVENAGFYAMVRLYERLVADGHTPCKKCFKYVIKHLAEKA